jgi:hypothetical protein
MFRLSGLFSLSLAVVCGSLLFWTSQSVQRAENKLSKITQSDVGEVEALRVLSAEWDYLNRPERLERLTKGNLDMDKSLAQSKNFIGVSEGIPQPIIPVLPKMKPAFLRDVSVQRETVPKKVTPKNVPEIIQKIERNNFDELIEKQSKGDQ